MRALLRVSDNPIYYLEVLPLLVTWTECLESKGIMIGDVPSDAARRSMIRCYAEASYVDRAIQRFLKFEARLQLRLQWSQAYLSRHHGDAGASPVTRNRGFMLRSSDGG